MAELDQLASDIWAFGGIRVLDLEQSAKTRSIHSPWVHDGIYYLAPKEERSASDLLTLLDLHKRKGEIHFDYNVQSAIDVPHRPILPLDPYAEEFFSEPKGGLLKVTAVARQKLADLQALFDALKPLFDDRSFPYLEQLQMTRYRPPIEGHQGALTFIPVVHDWKHLRDIEEAIRSFLAECFLGREILVSRHSVKGMHSEIVLTAAEALSPKGLAFLTSLVQFLQAHRMSDSEIEEVLEKDELPPFRHSTPILLNSISDPGQSRLSPN